MMPQYPKYPSFPRPVVDCSKDEPLTTQAEAKELDINRIVARMTRGEAVPVLRGQPFYGDVSEFDGLQDALIKVQEADDLFMSYPANIRERFENDPIKFVEFMSDTKNVEEAIKLGLAVKREAPKNEEGGKPDDKKPT